jgi:hypothetical protein
MEVFAMFQELAELANKLDERGLYKEADQVENFLASFAATKQTQRGDAVFQSTHPKVKDNKDHFPINDADQARNALARASQYSSAPPWYSGSLESLVGAVQRAVKSKYPSIKTTPKSKKPGKG